MKTRNPKTINSLYIHIPFCRHLCFYCDFPKLLLNHDFETKYMKMLLIELKAQKINHKLKTIYIGGGTPSCVNLLPLLKALQKYINAKTEFTIEANVLDINEQLLRTYQHYRVNRLSLGIQSTHDKLLKVLGREHTKVDVFNKIKLIKKYINNINIDLIYGFKELTNKLLVDELNDYLRLNVNHISTYSLEIHPGTKFYNDHRKELDSSLVREQFDIIYDNLTRHGYIRYETSNFAKKGYQAKHNLTYWKDEEYYGIGLGAASFIGQYRYKNTLNFFEYLKGRFISQKEKITLADDKKYYLMLNLRLADGINLKDYQHRFKTNLLDEKKTSIQSLKVRKLVKTNYNNLVTTYEGSMLLDIILEELF
ncbi:MAG: radical SAM family heme chaperone HemW [Bacilli bacterium]|nr:radical SAM family heme chaperone HemW [Bacilli bacterium]